MALPFSRVVAWQLSQAGRYEDALVGASGTKLVVQSSSGASSVWPTEGVAGSPVEPTSETGSPPRKKIKAEPTSDENTSNFTCLTLTNDKKHLVAVTAEDKCIRVFEIDLRRQLHQLSARCMARRPCAITVTADDSTILCADKFGDVWGLPLIPGPNDEIKEAPIEPTEPVEEKEYVPSATVFTVHSGRNRKVLEEQLKKRGAKRAKEAPPFKHELLLGHVSMLTDIAYATVDNRSYIITADRDEHIRVSRGPPQAHIIEGFCFGHEAFISRLCLAKNGMLVSGGGDPDLFVWDWQNYELLERPSIRDSVLEYMKSDPNLASTLPKNEDSFRIAVSGIWAQPWGSDDVNNVVVACEGIPALFVFSLGHGIEKASKTIPLAGNALDVTFIAPQADACLAVVSVDNVHVPGSTTELRKDDSPRLQYFSYQTTGDWDESPDAAAAFKGFGQHGGKGVEVKTAADQKALRDRLYGIENLRKRPGAED